MIIAGIGCTSLFERTYLCFYFMFDEFDLCAHWKTNIYDISWRISIQADGESLSYFVYSHINKFRIENESETVEMAVNIITVFDDTVLIKFIQQWNYHLFM